jgi:DNA polymerase-1
VSLFSMLYSDFWHKQLPVLARIERRGLHFDTDLAKLAEQATTKEISKHEDALNEWTRGYTEQRRGPINWNSAPQRVEFFYDYLGFDVPKFCGSERAVRLNRDNKRTTDEYTLVQWARGSSRHRPYIERLLRRQSAVKTRQFMRALPSHISDGTRRIHTSLSPSTESGRLASKNPNLQNIPSGNDIYGIRKCFTAPRNRALVVLDYSQLELYVLAHFLIEWFDDRTLADDLAGGDVHVATAVRCWNDASRRSDAKAINYSVNYGKTAVGLGAQIRDNDGNPIGTDAAADLLERYFEAYPGILEYQTRQQRVCRDRGFCTTLSARRRYLDYGTESWQGRAADRKALNTPIQGSAADLVTNALLLTADLPCVLQVHDELIFECEREKAPEVLAAATGAMESAGERFNLKVPLKVSGGIYENWGEAK